jgi:phosphoribosylglycinamide formyltransferase 1
VNDLVNLLVDLDERFATGASAREQLARAAFALADRADDRVHAWIDEIFGGAWSSEVADAQAIVAMQDDEPAGFAAYDPSAASYAWLRGAAAEPGTGIFGPFGVAEPFRKGQLGPALLHLALCGLKERGYARALIAAANDGLVPYYERLTGARVVERFDPRSFIPKPPRTVVLASGSGSNFQAVIDAVGCGLPLELVALVTNREDAYAIERARRADVPALHIVWDRAKENRYVYDITLLGAVEVYEPELVLLLGWMHLLAPAFVERFPQMLNVHPAFLPLDPRADTVVMPDATAIPAFRGPRAVRDAIGAGSAWTGASVHRVTAQTDRGRVYTRKPLRIVSGETEDDVLSQLHPIEHTLVTGAVKRWLYER